MEKIAELKKLVFASDGKTPDVRPGTSFLSTGIFGFGGNWQVLLNTNARYGSLYLSGETSSGCMRIPNSTGRSPSMRKTPPVPAMNLTADRGRMRTQEHLQKFRDRKRGDYRRLLERPCSGRSLRCARESRFRRESSLGVPVAPDAVAGVFDGKVRLIPQGNPIPSRRMSEGWLLLLWNGNPAPKLPVLLFFEQAPDQLEWGGGGFRIARSPEVGNMRRQRFTVPLRRSPISEETGKLFPRMF